MYPKRGVHLINRLIAANLNMTPSFALEFERPLVTLSQAWVLRCALGMPLYARMELPTFNWEKSK